MSTFNGILSEIASISVDRFDGHNLSSDNFFLSHCHMDHMIGLQNPDGLPGPLYTTGISAVFIKHQYSNIKNIIVLDVGVPKPVTTNHNGDNVEIVVTAIPAGHCPGSVMFLFQTHSELILYTGDFRLCPKDLRNIRAFKDVQIDSLYLDTTFFSKNYLEFPAQTESAISACNLIEDWTKKGNQYNVSIRIPARYGSEYLFIEIAKRLKKKIHVNDTEYRKYKYLSDIDDCVTNEGKSTQIHACLGNTISRTLYCTTLEDPKYLRVIRPSAMRWRNWTAENKITDKIKDGEELFGVCYSNHASYNEIKDLILYLKPKKIEFNVIPDGREGEKTRMKILLNEILDENTEIPGPSEEEIIKFDNISKAKKHKKYQKVFSYKDLADDEDKESSDEMCIPKRHKI